MPVLLSLVVYEAAALLADPEALSPRDPALVAFHEQTLAPYQLAIDACRRRCVLRHVHVARLARTRSLVDLIYRGRALTMILGVSPEGMSA
jgi:hypothetical protein